MASHKPISPNQSLRNFLQVISDEADMNMTFRNRLLMAIGVPVIFEGQDDIASVHPKELAARYDETTFKRIYGALKGPALKKILTTFHLASTGEVGAKGMKPPEFVELLWDRARGRAEEDGLI